MEVCLSSPTPILTSTTPVSLKIGARGSQNKQQSVMESEEIKDTQTSISTREKNTTHNSTRYYHEQGLNRKLKRIFEEAWKLVKKIRVLGQQFYDCPFPIVAQMFNELLTCYG
ncbi:hypothetical protein CHS0354_031404 [Potamilus streckersoni]|uniref:Uncharacterized protein n=1 Tax=Potamilus streckersoni TaxID=2493646 RepID=A0AAE0S2N0_9BIVA|nr:hypothetical protein CHS0354_031404 [Potamilus streckersoni]